MRLLDGESPFDPLAMERAHVIIRLRDGDHGDAAHARLRPAAQDKSSPTRGNSSASKAADGITRTSATTVRLEHSEMSPGVASITFEQVYDQEHSNADVFAQSIAPGVMKCVQGQSMSLVTTGAPRSGKSFTCHGDKQHKVTEDEPEFKYQVLMNCMHVADDHLMDMMVNPPEAIHPPFSVERTLVERPVRAGNTAEAVHYYSQALSQSSQMTHGNTDFVFILHIETQKANDRVRRGRFICIDTHGSSIVEPARFQDTPSANPLRSNKTASFFSDTHFPVRKSLSAWFSEFVGNETATFMLVTIQKRAQYQQQAIQSLLYACKAKDIKSTCAVHYLPSFSDKATATSQGITKFTKIDAQVHLTTKSSTNSVLSDIKADIPDAQLPGSPQSATSSDSASDVNLVSNDTVYAKWKSRTGGMKTMDQPTKQTIVVERLHRAYQTVKWSSLGNPHVSASASKDNQQDIESGKLDRFEGMFATKANFLHAKADAMLKNRPSELQALSLLDKLELIDAQYQEAEEALAHEMSIKEKCMDRISKLSQTMSFQVVEHEKQLQQVSVEKQQVQTQLDEMERKFGIVSSEVEQLQQQVQLMKVAREVPPLSPSPAGNGDRVLLQQFATRLGAAMEEAKGVVDFKDGVIKDLERRLEECMKEKTRYSEQIAQQKLSHDLEHQSLLSELKDLKELMQGNEKASQEHAEQLRQRNLELGAEVAQLQSKVGMINRDAVLRTQELERTRQSTTQLMKRNHLANISACEQQDVESILGKKTRECIMIQAACVASQRQAERLQVRVDEVTYKLEKKKKKMEKKLKALVNDRKSHKSACTRYQQELMAQLENASQKQHAAENEVAKLLVKVQHLEIDIVASRSEMKLLQGEHARLEKHCKDLQSCIDALETTNQSLVDQQREIESKYDEQIYNLEQSSAQTLVEREAQLTAEHERQVKKMMERHSEELFQRARMDNDADTIPPSSSSLPSIASSASDADPYSQQSIDQLDALISSKERQYARSAQGTPSPAAKKRPSSARQEQKFVEMQKRMAELTHALAVANEQETLAKEQAQKLLQERQENVVQQDHLLKEMNRLKQENWSLSLALQVTERQQGL